MTTVPLSMICLLKENGIFDFTFAMPVQNGHNSNSGGNPFFEEEKSLRGVSMFKHNADDIHKMTNTHLPAVRKGQWILAESGDKDAGDIVFQIFVTQKSAE